MLAQPPCETVDVCASVRCSWSAADCPAWLRVLADDGKGGGLTAAEEFMESTLEDGLPAGAVAAVLEAGVPAPWIQLLCSQPVTALCLSSNARVLEVHQTDGVGGKGGTAPVLTAEGRPAAEGVFLHFLHSGSAAPLLPAGVPYRLKLFGRRPKGDVRVLGMCLVVSEGKVEEVEVGELEGPRHAAAPAVLGPAELSLLFGIQSALHGLAGQLAAVEEKVAALDRRLSGVEEAVSAAAQKE